MIVPSFRTGTHIQIAYRNDYMEYTCTMRVYKTTTKPNGTQIVHAKTDDDAASIIFSTGDLKEAQSATWG